MVLQVIDLFSSSLLVVILLNSFIRSLVPVPPIHEHLFINESSHYTFILRSHLSDYEFSV